jgi:endoglucanase
MLAEDAAGNLTLSMAAAPRTSRPIYFTAHMDHPAFVVERIVAPGVVLLSFRGGVMGEYFSRARVVAFDARDGRHAGVLTGKEEGAPGPFPLYLAELDAPTDALSLGDIARWEFPPAEELDNCLHTDACDDLAALAAALAAYDVLLREASSMPPAQDVRLLFTRAEEIGFVGAIAACRLGTIPRDARLIALENSRSFPESPIHAGPIVRVGDRVSVFSPTLTDAIATRAEEVAGGQSTVTASQKLSELPKWKWQRKLMAGGACEASVFCTSGYEATCVCLPLGNYHNMGDLTNVQAGTHTSPPRVAREFIGLDDYDGLVDLLIACGQRLSETGSFAARVEKLWNDKKFVVGM